MRISYTSYRTFKSNEEEYRLSKGLGFQSETKSPALQRGTMMHLLAEQYFHKHPQSWLADRIVEERISEAGQQAGRFLWPTLQEYIDGRQGKIIAAEVTVITPVVSPVTGRTHEIECRVDALYQDFVMSVDDYKTTGRKWLTADKIEKENAVDPQKVFTVMAARTFDPTVSLFNLITVQEGTPPNIVLIPPAVVTDEDIRRLQYYCAIACDQIEWYIEHVGLDKPWIHNIPDQWTCYKCEFAGICQQEIQGCPEGFTIRENSLKQLLQEVAGQETGNQ